MEFPERNFELWVYGKTKLLKGLAERQKLDIIYDDYGQVRIPLKLPDSYVSIPPSNIHISCVSSDNILPLREIIQTIDPPENNLQKPEYHSNYRLVYRDSNSYRLIRGQTFPTEEYVRKTFGESVVKTMKYNFDWTETTLPFMDSLEKPVLSMFMRYDFRATDVRSNKYRKKGYYIYKSGLAQLDYFTPRNCLRAIGNVSKHGELFRIPRAKVNEIKGKFNFTIINNEPKFEDCDISVPHEEESQAERLLGISMSDHIEFHPNTLVMGLFFRSKLKEPPFGVNETPIETHFHPVEKETTTPVIVDLGDTSIVQHT
jgi:hypothetical protein